LKGERDPRLTIERQRPGVAPYYRLR